MNAYSVAAQLLGDLQLSSDQYAQLRALDYRLQLEIQRRLRARDETGALPRQAPGTAPTDAGLGPDDLAALRTMLLADIREMLTPQQCDILDRRGP